MDMCIICGREYDPIVDPQHEDICRDKLDTSFEVAAKSDPVLMRLLESLINEKATM